MEEQKRELTKEQEEKIKKLQEELTTDKNNALEKQEKKLTADKEEALSTQKATLTKEKEQELTKLQDDLISEKSKELEAQEKKLTEEKENDLRNQKDSYENKINDKKKEFTEAVSEYKTFLEYMAQCDSMNPLVAKLKIQDVENITIRDALAIANLVGQDFSFAELVYNTLSAYQKNQFESGHANALTPIEMDFIHAINGYYKQLYTEESYQEFDVLDCLGFENSDKVKFERKTMRDLSNARGADYLDAVELYVPAFRKTKEEIVYKAYIKGE